MEIVHASGHHLVGAIDDQFETVWPFDQHISGSGTFQRDEILALAAARGASRVRVFGSAAKGHDQEGSDLDLSVDLPLGSSLLQIVGLQLDLEDALRVKVDICTERELHPALKQRLQAEARTV